MDGENSDWIEIYNSGEDEINLLGYTLSDKQNELDKWTFPDIVLDSKEFLLVFASGKDTINQNELHTNFKIKNSGEHLLLSNQFGVIIDQLPPVILSEDISYGRFPNGADSFFFFELSTPAASNQESTQVISSHQSGFYTEPFFLQLQSPSNQSVIHYTIDGSDPTLESPVYNSPIFIDFATYINEGLSFIPTTPLDRLMNYTWKPPGEPVYKIKVVKYLSYKNGEPVNSIQAKTFLVDPQAASRFTFPVFSIIIDQDHLFDYENGIYIPGKVFDTSGWINNKPIGNYSIRGSETERPFHLNYLEPDGQLGLDLAAGLRIHGSYSRRSSQKGLKFYFRSEYGENKIDYPLFDEGAVDEFKRLSIKSSDLSRTLLKDYLLQTLMKDSRVDGQESKFIVVFINGEYWGIFTLQERQDKYYLKYKYDLEEDKVIITNACGFNDEGRQEPLHQALMDFIRETDWSTSESFDQLEELIDVDNFIDYMIAETFIANTDWPGNNYKMWRSVEEKSKWRWLLYDLDNTFGIGTAKIDFNSILHVTQPNSTHWSNPDCSTLLFRTAISNQVFQDRFLTRVSEILNTTFSTTNLLSQIEQARLLLLPEVHEQINRWNQPVNIETWENEIDILKKFARERPCQFRKIILDYFKLEEKALSFNDNCTFTAKDTTIASSVILFPNPGDGRIQLEFDPESYHLNGPIEVYLMDGRFVKQTNFTTIAIDQISFDLSDLENGIYILRFSAFEGPFTTKITILK